VVAASVLSKFVGWTCSVAVAAPMSRIATTQ
jgi:hypothetical protein